MILTKPLTIYNINLIICLFLFAESVNYYIFFLKIDFNKKSNILYYKSSKRNILL